MKKTKMLRKNYEFSRIFSKGEYFSGNTIEAFILKNSGNSNYLGIAINKKNGHAYQRNRVKRLLRENYKELEESMKTGYSIVFLWKNKVEIEKASFNQIKEDMHEILKKSKIIGV